MDRWQRVPWHRSPLVLRLTSLPSRLSKILPAPGSTCAPCLRQQDPLQSIDVTVPSSSRSGSRNYPTRFVFALRASHRVFHPSPRIVITPPCSSSRSLDQCIDVCHHFTAIPNTTLNTYIYRFEYIGSEHRIPSSSKSLDRVSVRRREKGARSSGRDRFDPRSSIPLSSFLILISTKMLPHYRLFQELG